MDLSSDDSKFEPKTLAECPFKSSNHLAWSLDASKLYYSKNGYEFRKSILVAINIESKSIENLFDNVPKQSSDSMPKVIPLKKWLRADQRGHDLPSAGRQDKHYFEVNQNLIVHFFSGITFGSCFLGNKTFFPLSIARHSAIDQFTWS